MNHVHGKAEDSVISGKIRNIKARADRVLVQIFYIGILAVGLFASVEFVARQFPDRSQKRKSDIRRIQARVYSKESWGEDYCRDMAIPTKTGNELVYEPYSLWKHDDKQTETVNIRNGYRTTWSPEENSSKEDRIVYIFGGSTVFCHEVPDEYTLPSWIAKKLNQTSSQYRYVVHNYSASGFVNDNEIHLLVDLLRRGGKPNIVIFYDGVNEIINRVAHGRPHYVFQRFASRNEKYSVKEFLAKIAGKLRIVSVLRGSQQDSITEGPRLDDNATQMMNNYKNNVAFVEALEKQYDFKSFFFWQASIFDSGKQLKPEELLAKELSDDMAPAFGVAARKLTSEGFFLKTGVYDIRRCFDDIDDTIFTDICHVTSAGNKRVAEAMISRIFNE